MTKYERGSKSSFATLDVATESASIKKSLVHARLSPTCLQLLAAQHRAHNDLVGIHETVCRVAFPELIRSKYSLTPHTASHRLTRMIRQSRWLFSPADHCFCQQGWLDEALKAKFAYIWVSTRCWEAAAIYGSPTAIQSAKA